MIVLEPPFHFNLKLVGERIRLIDSVWAASGAKQLGNAEAANPELAEMLREMLRNTYDDRDRGEAHERSTSSHVDGILLGLARSKNIHVTTLTTAVNSVVLYRAQTPETVWRLLGVFAPGLFMSDTWTETFIKDACQRRPPPPYEVISGVGGCFFDNYTRKLLYSAMMVGGESGTRLDMCTNGSFDIPLHLSPNFDAKALCKHARVLYPRVCACPPYPPT